MFQLTVTFVGENGVHVQPGPSSVLGTNLTAAQAAGVLRAYHAENAWATELDHPAYAAQHYAGLAVIEQLAAMGPADQHPGYLLVPVQFGVLVVS